MIKSRWYFHPLTIFIFSLVALAFSFYLYLRTYLRVTEAFQRIAKQNNLQSSQFLDFETWVIVLILSVLLGIIILGIALIYTYYQKMILLLRQQQNFISGFTHELKTPITSLQLFLDTLSRHNLTREQQLHYLELMKKDTERLSNDVHQILELARLEDKKEKREFFSKDIVDFFTGFIDSRKHLLDRLSIDVDDSVFTNQDDVRRFVLLNPDLIEILFMNIFINCQKYRGLSDGKVSISFAPKEKKLHIHIRDWGIGLNRDQQRKIFKKFYQATKTGKGSGIGLYISQLVARVHGGDIWARSQGKNQGTTVTVSLPYAKTANG